MSVYSNMALAEVAKEQNVSGSAAQFMIEAHRLDLSLFNAVIECDFLDAMGKAGLIAFTEADQETSKSVRKDGIISKIKTLIEKAVAFVMGKLSDLKNAVTGLIDKDKTMYVKFEKEITVEKIKGCPVKGDVPNIEAFGKLQEKLETAYFFTAARKIDAAADAAAVDAIVADTKKNVEELIAEISGKDAMKKFFNTEDKPVVEKMDDTDIQTMKATIKSGYKNNVRLFEVMANAAKKELDITKKEIERDKKDEKDELAIAKLNGKAACVSVLINYVTKYTAFGSAAVKEMIKTYRRIFAQLGIYATKGAKDNSEAAKEEAQTEAFATAMFSDAVVEEAFEL